MNILYRHGNIEKIINQYKSIAMNDDKLLAKFKDELKKNHPEYEILELKINEKPVKTITAEAKAKEAIVDPIGNVLRIDFTQRIITFWMNFNDFQFIRELIIKIPSGKIPSVESIRDDNNKNKGKLI
jgi:hypothetical protein